MMVRVESLERDIKSQMKKGNLIFPSKNTSSFGKNKSVGEGENEGEGERGKSEDGKNREGRK